jgi:hypothetical protein
LLLYERERERRPAGIIIEEDDDEARAEGAVPMDGDPAAANSTETSYY